VLLALGALAYVLLPRLGLRYGDDTPSGGTPSAIGPSQAAPTEGVGAGGTGSGTPGIPDPGARGRVDPNQGPVGAGGIEFGRGGEYTKVPKTFTGRGTLVVDVQVAPGLDFPAEWTLHIEPSPLAEGHAHAVDRTRVIATGERSVEELDLPMAAYRVYATAAGLASLPQDVVLHGLEGYPHLRGVDFVRVSTTLQPAAEVVGSVVDSRGLAANELQITLREVGGSRRLRTHTQVNGTYSIADVSPGAWALLVGDPDRPFLLPGRVDVFAGRTEVPQLTLPPLVHVEVRAIDRFERPVPGTEVSGHRREASGGGLRGVTGPDGLLLVRYVKPGRWRLDGAHGELHLEGRGDVEVSLEGDGRTGAGPDGVQRIDLYIAPAER